MLPEIRNIKNDGKNFIRNFLKRVSLTDYRFLLIKEFDPTESKTN